MEIKIDRTTAQVSVTPLHEFSVSENIWIWGQIECINSNDRIIYYPNPIQIKSYLSQFPMEGIIDNTTKIEGQYLIVWRKEKRCYIFCDRYSIQIVYYRLTNNSLTLFDRILSCQLKLFISTENAMAFMLLRYVPGRQTLFSGIYRIMPGDCLILDSKTGELDTELAKAYPEIITDQLSEENTAEKFHSLFRNALEKRIANHSANEKFILPISGGLDSRYILGTALEIVSTDRIIATTYGTQGSFDFEIGKSVAKAAGVKHIAHSLSVEDYNESALLKSCKDSDGQINFITEAPLKVYEDYAQYGNVILSGYVGDAIMGNKAQYMSDCSHQSILLKDATIGNADSIRTVIPSTLIDSSFYNQNQIEYPLDKSEMWFFINHFTKYSMYSVFKQREYFKYINPFIDYSFSDFVLNLPIELRKGQTLYIYWLKRKFPLLFSLSCKTYHGTSLDAGSLNRFVFKQWHRFNRHVLRNRKEINTIDFFRYKKNLLETESLVNGMKDVFPDGFMEMIHKSRYPYLLLYNLKCLDILRTNFAVAFDYEPPQP